MILLGCLAVTSVGHSADEVVQAQDGQSQMKLAEEAETSGEEMDDADVEQHAKEGLADAFTAAFSVPDKEMDARMHAMGSSSVQVEIKEHEQVFSAAAVNESANVTLAKTNLTVEKSNVTVEKSNATAERTNATAEKANATVEKANVTVETATVAVRQPTVETTNVAAAVANGSSNASISGSAIAAQPSAQQANATVAAASAAGQSVPANATPSMDGNWKADALRAMDAFEALPSNATKAKLMSVLAAAKEVHGVASDTAADLSMALDGRAGQLPAPETAMLEMSSEDGAMLEATAEVSQMSQQALEARFQASDSLIEAFDRFTASANFDSGPEDAKEKLPEALQDFERSPSDKKAHEKLVSLLYLFEGPDAEKEGQANAALALEKALDAFEATQR